MPYFSDETDLPARQNWAQKGYVWIFLIEKEIEKGVSLFIIWYKCHSKRILIGLKDLSNVILPYTNQPSIPLNALRKKDEQNRTSTAYMGSTS